MASSPIRVAVLDDYANTAPEYFKSLQNISVTHIPDTIPLPYNDKTLVSQASRLKDFTIISTMRERTPFPRTLLEKLPNLRLLLTTGLKNAAIDLSACKEFGITVAGASGSTSARKGYDRTNEHTWALILALAKGIARDDKTVKETTGWQSGLNLGLGGKTLGLLGLGKLGAQCAFTGYLGFGMDIICWSNSLTQEKADSIAAERGIERGKFKVVGIKKELFEQADFLSVHYVLSDRSRGIVGKEEFEFMKKNALLINTSRGPLIDQDALLATLKAGKIRGAALDVYDIEPLPEKSEWRTTKWGKDGRSEVLLSPHTGYVEEDTMKAWYQQTAENVKRFVKGEEIQAKFQ